MYQDAGVTVGRPANVFERFHGGVYINGKHWKKDDFFEYRKRTAQGRVNAYAKVLYIYRITIITENNPPIVHKLILAQKYRSLRTEFGGVTIDPSQGRGRVTISIAKTTHRIHLARHRTSATLRTGIRSGATHC